MLTSKQIFDHNEWSKRLCVNVCVKVHDLIYLNLIMFYEREKCYFLDKIYQVLKITTDKLKIYATYYQKKYFF